MRRASAIVLVVVSAVSVVLPTPALSQTPVPPLVLTHANLIDGISAQPLRDVAILVRDGRIERISPSRTGSPANAIVMDLKGRWVLPGFIDAHAHLRDLRAARTALQSGVTTARVLGTPHFADVGLRELHRRGAPDVPDVLAAGYQLGGRLADDMFLDIPEFVDLMGGLSGVEGVRRFVRAMANRHVHVIKVLATQRAGLPEDDPRKRTLSDEELAAAVDEAKRAGLPVAAHAHGDEGARAAVLAGVRTIEHGTFLSDATLALMRDRGTCFVPTTTFWSDLLSPGGEYDDPQLVSRARAMLPRVHEATAHAWKMGVKVVAGTDTRYDSTSNRRLADEISELLHSGVPPMGALRAATSVAAACLGISRRTGAVKPGLEADLLVVERDPLTDLSALYDVLLVVNDGKIALNRLEQ